MLEGFKNFLFKGNVVDLAVAVIVGAAFGAVVDSIVKDIITPIIGLIGGQPDFSAIRILADSKGMGGIAIGNFLNTIIAFVIKSAAVYFIIVLPMQRMMAMMNKPVLAAVEPTASEKLLAEIRDALRK